MQQPISHTKAFQTYLRAPHHELLSVEAGEADPWLPEEVQEEATFPTGAFWVVEEAEVVELIFLEVVEAQVEQAGQAPHREGGLLKTVDFVEEVQRVDASA